MLAHNRRWLSVPEDDLWVQQAAVNMNVTWILATPRVILASRSSPPGVIVPE